MNENTTILVVDDNPANLQVVSLFLKTKEYKLALVLDGHHALQVLDSTKIDLILLDIMMPEMDGFELCKRIKQNPNTKDIPIIFLSAVTETLDVVKAFTIGGVDYITKPMQGAELLARIETHLTISRLQQQLVEANENLEQIVELRTKLFVEANKELSCKVNELKNANEQISKNNAEKELLQQEMVLATIQSEENERTRISQELHDGLGPILTTIKLYLQWFAKPDALQNKEELVNQTISITDEAILSVKEISNKLSPHVLAKYGLTVAIESFTKKINLTTALKFSINVLFQERFEHNVEILLYRVIVECINNSLKYANAQNIIIEVKLEDNWIVVNYNDDGKGFDIGYVRKSKNGLGLMNMQNRVETLKGIFEIKSSVGTGMSLQVRIPYIEKM